VIGVWLFTAREPTEIGCEISPTARAVARCGYILAVLHLLLDLLLEIFVPHNVIRAILMMSTSLVVWAVPQFAIFRYARHLWHGLGKPSLAQQAAVLTWIFPLVLGCANAYIYAGRIFPNYAAGFAAYRPLVVWFALLVRGWAIAVLFWHVTGPVHIRGLSNSQAYPGAGEY
jgi:hypothetical protein